MKLNRRQVLKSAALGAGGAMLGGLRPVLAAADDIVIGASIPLTGVFAFAGVGINDGIQDYVKLVNEGGEFHTFTDLTAHGGFGPGCVDLINLIIFGDPTLNDVCDDAGFDPVGVPPGSTNTVAAAALAPGVHFFQCLIHPWMQTTVEVRGHHH